MPENIFRFWLIYCLMTITALVAQPKPVTIGIVVDGSWERNEEVQTMIVSEINTLMANEFDVRFPDDKNLNGNWQVSGINAALNQLLDDSEVDIVMALGVIASHQIIRRRNVPKPVIAPFVIDVVLQDLPRSDGASGIKNVNYIAFPTTIRQDINTFREIVPFQSVMVLMNATVVEAIPGLESSFQQMISSTNISAKIVAVAEVKDALTALDNQPEAVYVAPLLNLSQGDLQQIVASMREKKIPSYSLLGRIEVEKGILASLKPNVFPRLSRRIALNLQQILLGEDPGKIPYGFSAGEELSINMATARAIGVFPSWALLTEAVLLEEQRTEISRNLTLQSAVAEGLMVNRDLLAAKSELAAGREDIGIARSNLLPQISLSATGVQIDEDRASLFQRERTMQGSASLSQVLFSDGAITNYRAAKNNQEGRAQQYQATHLDIAQSVANAYLQLLSAKTFERVRQNNLKLSRSNLELARIRESIGYSGRSEVFRWESQIATNRSEVIAANARRNVAEIQLNRLLNRPLEEKFTTKESELREAGMLTEDARWHQYMSNPWSFRVLRSFLVEEGLARSPEMQQLDAAIRAQELAAGNTTRSLFLPTLALQAEVTNIFDRSGAPDDTAGAPPAGLDLSFLGANADDTNWQIAVNLSFPLFEGGAKFNRRHQAQEQLLQLRYQRESLAQGIEQRIRSAAHIAGSSYAGINQAEKAAIAARENLKLTVDAYSRGVLSIISLLDAQNATLQAEESEAGAIYQFLIDQLALERAIGQIQFLRSAEEKAEFFRQLDAFFADNKN